LALVTEAISAFPDSAQLWLLHGRVIMAAPDEDVSDTALRSFEMAIKLASSPADADEALRQYFNGATMRRGCGGRESGKPLRFKPGVRSFRSRISVSE
jgi:hypothetical protein